MRHLTLVLLAFSGLTLTGQNEPAMPEGKVTYVNGQSVYVQFRSTAMIKAGDTLYTKEKDKLVPAMVVRNLSSISCVCTPLPGSDVQTGDKITFRPSEMSIVHFLPPVPVAMPSEAANSVSVAKAPDTTPAKKPAKVVSGQLIRGFFSAASYSNFGNSSYMHSQSEKFTLSLRVGPSTSSGLSGECFITWYQNDQQYNVTENSVFNKLKIYDLAVIYDFGNKATVSLGRKLNPKLSNLGSNDGLQAEVRFRPLSVGLIAGFRPDYADFGFNGNLLQFGTYLYNELAAHSGSIQTTLAFINQTNTGKTDRRFFYLQHVNSLLKNITFFASFELDIFGKAFNSSDSTYRTTYTPSLTNTYVSVNYRLLWKLGITLSYSNRQNVIYYETYKNYLDRLLENPALQGYSLQANYSPVRNLSVGGAASYRFENPDPRHTGNVYAYLTYSDIPGIKSCATISWMRMQTAYLNGKIYSAGLSKDFFRGRLWLGTTYRYIDYHYTGETDIPTYQSVAEVNLTWRIIRKLLFSAYYEGTFDKVEKFNRIYAQITVSI